MRRPYVSLLALTVALATSPYVQAAENSQPACNTLRDELLSDPVQMIWKNSRDVSIHLVVQYQLEDASWMTEDVILPDKSQREFEVHGRCLYWFGKRGQAFYKPKVEKNNASDVLLPFEGKDVQAIGWDLDGRDGVRLTFTLK